MKDDNKLKKSDNNYISIVDNNYIYFTTWK